MDSTASTHEPSRQGKIRTIGDASQGRRNNFDLMRHVAAIAVIFSHAFPLSTGDSTLEPLASWTSGQARLGGLAVSVFFIISGFLIAQSYDRSKSLIDFCWARFLRIMPGLVGVALVSTFILGPLLTELPLGDYVNHPETLQYLKIIFLRIKIYGPDSLPGVFLHNPFTSTVNGSLWTLKPEVLCYGGVAALGVARMLRRVVVLPLLASSIYFSSGSTNPILPLASLFLGGVAVYCFRESIQLRWWLAIAAFACLVLSARFGGFSFVLPLLGPYLIGYIGFSGGALEQFTKHGDFSYGLYVYAFPVQQALIARFHVANPIANFLLAVPLSLLLAFGSWHLIEKRALRLKPTLRKVVAKMGGLTSGASMKGN